MKIYNEVIVQWNEETQLYETIYEDSFDYTEKIDMLMPPDPGSYWNGGGDSSGADSGGSDSGGGSGGGDTARSHICEHDDIIDDMFGCNNCNGGECAYAPVSDQTIYSYTITIGVTYEDVNTSNGVGVYFCRSNETIGNSPGDTMFDTDNCVLFSVIPSVTDSPTWRGENVTWNVFSNDCNSNIENKGQWSHTVLGSDSCYPDVDYNYKFYVIETEDNNDEWSISPFTLHTDICNDESACNYNPTSTDDTECYYADYSGISHGAVLCDSNIIEIKCNVEECIHYYGCTDINACNCFSSSDGGCAGLYQSECIEWLDTCNSVYNGIAQSCLDDLPPPVSIGFYNPHSIEDNNQCEYLSDTCRIADFDGNLYKVVMIDQLVWMSENLKVTHYQNGDVIPNITNNGDWGSLTTGAYGDYDNNPTNSETYGRLYNWYTVDDDRGICPDGWHVPTDDEWKELEMFLGMSQSEADDTGLRGTNEGSKLAGNAELWNDGDLVNNSEFGTSGFNGLPGGYRGSESGNYLYMGNYGYFWSSSGYSSTTALGRLLQSYNTEVVRGAYSNEQGGSIRCVKSIEDYVMCSDVYIHGCMDEDACNYNQYAELDDGNCWYPDDGCECIDGMNAITDCNDQCNGNAYIDDCDICVGGTTNLLPNHMDVGCGCGAPPPVTYYEDVDFDNMGDPHTSEEYCLYHSDILTNSVIHANIVPTNINNDFYHDPCPTGYPDIESDGWESGWCMDNTDHCPDDASGVWDECNQCYGGNTHENCVGSDWNEDECTLMDCTGICGSHAVLDDCGECTGGTTGLNNNTCDGEVENNICTGNVILSSGTSYGFDCSGMCSGTAYINECSICVGEFDSIPDEIYNYDPVSPSDQSYEVIYGQDCAGICCDDVECTSSINFIDECGWCVGESTNTSTFNCYSNVSLYGYDIAVNGGTSSQGVEIEPMNVDVCENGWSKDCNGTCHGNAMIDACNICSGDQTGKSVNTCSQLMVNGRCNGEFSGSNIDSCGDCNVDCIEGITEIIDGGCNSWNSGCSDCNGDPGGNAFVDDCGDCVEGNTEISSNCKISDEHPEGVGYGCINFISNGGVHGNLELDCNNLCSTNTQSPDINYGAILDECGECSDNDGSYGPYFTNTYGVVGHVYDSDRDCGGICNSTTSLCTELNCDGGCDPYDNSCDDWMGDQGNNGVDECGVCRGNNYGCDYPYNDINLDELWFDDGCSCSGCINNPLSMGYTNNSPGWYDDSLSIDNGSCRYVSSSREFHPNEGGVLVSPDDSNVWVEIVPGTFDSPAMVTLEKNELNVDTIPLLPEGDEFNDDMMYKLYIDTSPNIPIRIVMGYNESWDSPNFIRMVNVVGEASDGNNYHDKWSSITPASQTTPSFTDCNYNGGEDCTDNHLGYIDVMNQYIYFTIGNIHGDIVYGCTDEIAMNYHSSANVQYQPLDCINGDVPTSGCCIYFDTQCPTGISGMTDFPLITIDSGFKNYVGFTLPPKSDLICAGNRSNDESCLDALEGDTCGTNPDFFFTAKCSQYDLSEILNNSIFIDEDLTELRPWQESETIYYELNGQIFIGEYRNSWSSSGLKWQFLGYPGILPGTGIQINPLPNVSGTKFYIKWNENRE